MRDFRSSFNFHEDDEWYQQQLERERRSRALGQKLIIAVILIIALIFGCVSCNAIYNRTESPVESVQ